MSTGLPSRRSSSPPPPISGTHRISSRPPPASSPPRSHPDLLGSNGVSAHFRPARLNAADLPADLGCRFQCDGAFIGPLPVLDLSTTGFAAQSLSGLVWAPGTVLESFELLLGDRAIWSGEAVVVHGSEDRMGARFTSGIVDLRRLRLGATLEGRMAILAEQKERLPAEWRARVGDLRQLLDDVRHEVDELELSETQDPLQRRDEETQLFEELRARWGTVFYGAVAELHEASRALDPRAVQLGRGYASAVLMPVLMACALQRRAYEKPLGYAGDYRMMELCFAPEPTGDGLFARFLHSIGQNYGLVRTVVAREAVMRSAVRGASEAPGDAPIRILALAAGPAIELRRWLEETPMLGRPVHLILLDQDPSAHESAHRHLTRILLERHHGMLPVTVQCLHFSVRQLLKPLTPDDHEVCDALRDLDLVYSAGLYDYLPELVALRLTRTLYGKLRPSGRMLMGNLVETPDSTWMMEYVLGWTLLYRTDESMLRLGHRLSPAPERVGITRDTTGRCLFLDVRKPATGSIA